MCECPVKLAGGTWLVISVVEVHGGMDACPVELGGGTGWWGWLLVVHGRMGGCAKLVERQLERAGGACC